MPHDVIIGFSGGMDSATLLGMARHDRLKPLAVGFRYGSKHNAWELAAAQQVASAMQIDFTIIDLSSAFRSIQSALLNDDLAVPKGHPEAPQQRATVVPGRNMIFASVLAGIAMSEGIRHLWMGMHAGDAAIYPDCRPDFVAGVRSAVGAAAEYRLDVTAPYLLLNKEAILRDGIRFQVPYHLTRTCYRNQAIACGTCGSCQERLAAWKAIGVEDPLKYETREILPK